MKSEARFVDNDLFFMRLKQVERKNVSAFLEDELQPISAESSDPSPRISLPFLAAWLLFALGLGWFGYSKGFSLTPPQALQAASVAPTITKPALKTERIADLKVGLRVLAQNPETPGEEPPALEISDPDQWRLFTLEQQKGEGGTLRIELLRPVAGVAAAVLTEEDLLPRTSGLPLAAEVFAYLQPAVRISARTIALGAELGLQFAQTPDIDQLLLGETLELDLPEMGAVGKALIVGIAPCPEIEKGAGRIITVRFIHQAANVVDLKLSSETEPIGTTDNHPFWSEERQEYVPAGELRVGETLRTVNGSQTYVQSIRPRGPPRTSTTSRSKAHTPTTSAPPASSSTTAVLLSHMQRGRDIIFLQREHSKTLMVMTRDWLYQYPSRNSDDSILITIK